MRPRLLVTAACAVALLAGGCGGDGETSARQEDRDGAADSFAQADPADQVAAAKSAMQDVHAVHLTGTLSNAGQSADVDLTLADDGSCDGTFSIGDGVAEIRAVDGSAWFRPDAEIWSAFAGANAERVTDFVGDKWVVLEEAQFLEMCDFRSIIDGLIAGSDAGREYTADGTEEVDGDEALRIRSDGPGGTTYGYVRASAPHYLVRTERRGGEAPAVMTFSDFDVEPEVEAPDAADVIDLDDLGS